MNPRFASGLAALVVVLDAGTARLAHLGPFADEAIRIGDTAVMSSLAFKENYRAMKAGSLAEQQAVDVACSLFSAMATAGTPPREWTTFEGALADRMGVTDSSKFIEGKIERLAAAIALAEQSPVAALRYSRHCIV